MLPSAFFVRDSAVVAPELLGKGLMVQREGRLLLARIVEVEAYRGAEDAASHAFRGETKRNRSMFGEGGKCYVYVSYGMHLCMNVVTEGPGIGQAVLIRAAEPIAGVETMAQNRGVAITSERDLRNSSADRGS